MVENKKIMNATKCSIGDIKFDSKLEMFMYQLLANSGVPFEFKPKYILQEKFRYNNTAVREITYTPDFFLEQKGILIDVKGFRNETFPLKKKMLFKHLMDNGFYYKFFTPKNQKECNALVFKIKLKLI